MIFSDKQYEPDVLHRLWRVQVEILDVIHDFCQKHQIKYSIAYGTLLGAVRHKGFIPWDDDIDIMMLRVDFERFRSLWLENPPNGYILADDRLYSEYHENFMKIRKKNTTFIQFESEYKTKELPLGIFVDVFVLDRVAPMGIARKKQFFASMINMLFTRGYTSGKGGLIGIGERVLLSFPYGLKRIIKQKAERCIKRWNHCSQFELVNFCTLNDSSFLFPPDMMNNLTTLQFCDKEFCAVGDYERILKLYFGNYLQLPPENQRASHYPLLLDFESDYKRVSDK